jgi:hypothetical protein
VRARPLFGSLVPYAGLRLFGRLDDRQLAAGQIYIAPPQGGYLATPQAPQHRKEHWNEYPLAPNGCDQLGSLSQIVGLHCAMRNLWWIDSPGGVANQHL